jgi:AcrR family transcriptional regulator
VDLKGSTLQKQPTERRNRDAEMLVAATRIFASKGYAGASVQDVATAIGVLKGSLYHYIDGKEDLLYRIFEQSYIEDIDLRAEIEAMDADPLTKLRTYFERYVRNALVHLERTSLYFRDWRNLTGERLEKVLEQRRSYEVFIRQLIEDMYSAGQAERGIKSKYISFFIIGGVHWVSDWYHESGPDSPEVVAESFADLAVAVIQGTKSVSALTENGPV